MAAGPQAGVQVDPADAPRCATVRSQHLAQGAVAPGGFGAAKEQTLRVGMLAARDGGLPGRLAVRGQVLLHGRLVGRARRPGVGDDKVRNGGVVRVDGQGLAEVLEVAVEVHVFVRDPAQVREAIGVERMQVEHGHALRMRRRAPISVMQRVHLHAAAAKALHAMAGAADDQQLVGIRRAITRHVQCQRFALAAGQRVRVRLQRQARRGSGLQKARPGLCVVGRKGL
jgi:hypothetical protein